MMAVYDVLLRLGSKPAPDTVDSPQWNLLVVSADPAVHAIASSLLEPFGFRILHARSSAEAVQICERDYVAVDCALLTLARNEARAIDVVESLRSRNPGLPVLHMRAWDDGGVIRISLDTPGATAGSGPDSLAEGIRSAIGRFSH